MRGNGRRHEEEQPRRPAEARSGVSRATDSPRVATLPDNSSLKQNASHTHTHTVRGSAGSEAVDPLPAVGTDTEREREEVIVGGRRENPELKDRAALRGSLKTSRVLGGAPKSGSTDLDEFRFYLYHNPVFPQM